MICCDIKIGIPSRDSTTFWRTIGTVFMPDDAVLVHPNGKPITFVIDYPKANGIIVKREKKSESKDKNEENQGQDL